MWKIVDERRAKAVERERLYLEEVFRERQRRQSLGTFQKEADKKLND